MKTVELKKVPFELQGNKDIFDYRVVLQMLMETPENPDKGAGIVEIRKSIRVLDVLESAGETAEFEDADFAYILARVRGMKFTAAHKVFAEFYDYFESVAA